MGCLLWGENKTMSKEEINICEHPASARRVWVYEYGLFKRLKVYCNVCQQRLKEFE